MKFRSGHVSNSSSCSFVIDKSFLSSEQIDDIINVHKAIYKYINVKEEGVYGEYKVLTYDQEVYFKHIAEWDIADGGRYIYGTTFMDNFDFYTYLIMVGVEREAIRWEGDD